MSPIYSRSQDRSLSVRVFDVIVRNCVASFDASAALSTRLHIKDIGPIAFAASPRQSRGLTA